jgi:LacI family transcriptional regulator
MVFWAGPASTDRPVEGVRFVPLEERAGVAEAMEDLQRLGHRHVATVGYGGTWVVGRQEAMTKAVEASGIRMTPMDRARSREECFAATIEVLSSADRPTAILIQPHHAVPIVFQAIRALRLKVPDDLSVIAFGDSEWMTALTPQVSVLALPIDEVAIHGIDMLAAMIEGKDELPEFRPSPLRYVRRGTVGPAPVLAAAKG